MDLSGFMAAARGALLSEHRWELEQTFRNLMLHENMNLEKGLSKQKKVGSSYSQGVEEEVGERERCLCGINTESEESLRCAFVTAKGQATLG